MNTEQTAHNTALAAKWREKNRAHFNEYHKKYRSDPQRKIAWTYRIRLSEIIARAAGRLDESRISEQRMVWLTGLTKSEFVEHIKSQFKEGMTLQNYGKRKDNWSLDHIEACSSYDLTDEAQLRKCFHHSNLRPLWHSENARKARRERDSMSKVHTNVTQESSPLANSTNLVQPATVCPTQPTFSKNSSVDPSASPPASLSDLKMPEATLASSPPATATL